MILCIVGPSCAGKSTSAEVLSEHRGFRSIEASDYVVDRYEDNGEGASIIEFVKSEFNDKGEDTFAEDVISDIGPDADNPTIICGYRTVEEVKYTEKVYSQVKVIGIYCNSLLRYQRKIRRDNPGTEYSYEQFIEKDFEELCFGISDLLNTQCDEIIVNEGSVGDLKMELNECVSNIESI